MGNTLKRIQNARLSGNSRVGSATECPICARIFGTHDTYNSINMHIDACINRQSQQSINTISRKSSFENAGVFTSYDITIDEEGGKKWVRKKETALSNAELKTVLSYSAKEVELLNMQEKQAWFKNELEKIRVPWTAGCNQLHINRDTVIQDSLEQLVPVDLHMELKINFNGELANDAGGVIREWFTILFKSLLSENYGLFILCDTDNMTYKINENSDMIESYDELFRLFGTLLGKAVLDHVPLNLCLAKSIFKYLLKKPCSLEDLKYVDKTIYNSLSYIANNEINNEWLVEEYFLVCRDRMGTIEQIPLKTNGDTVKVTDENKDEYIDLRVNWICEKGIKKQLKALRSGFYKVVPYKLIKVFTAEELERVICGLPFIDIQDWKENSVYKGLYNPKQQVITWFWDAMGAYNQDQLSKFLQFCTGTSRVPLEGFRVLESNRGTKAKFCIQSVKFDNKSEANYPRAHTCFNRIDLPTYPSYKALKSSLDFVIENEVLGFGLE